MAYRYPPVDRAVILDRGTAFSETGSPTGDTTISMVVPSGGAATPNPADWPIGVLWRMKDVNRRALSITTSQILAGGQLRLRISTAPASSTETFAVLGLFDGSNLSTASGVLMRIKFTGATRELEIGKSAAGTASWGSAGAYATMDRAFGAWGFADDARTWQGMAAGYDGDWLTRRAFSALANLQDLSGDLYFGFFGGRLSTTGGTIGGLAGHTIASNCDLDLE